MAQDAHASRQCSAPLADLRSGGVRSAQTAPGQCLDQCKLPPCPAGSLSPGGSLPLSVYYLTPPVVPSRRRPGQLPTPSWAVPHISERKPAFFPKTVYKLFISPSRFCLNYGLGYECKHEVLKFLPFLPLLLQHTQARGPGGSPGPLAVLSYPSWGAPVYGAAPSPGCGNCS